MEERGTVGAYSGSRPSARDAEKTVASPVLSIQLSKNLRQADGLARRFYMAVYGFGPGSVYSVAWSSILTSCGARIQTLRIIPGAGHSSSMEEPAAVNREVAEFLAGLG